MAAHELDDRSATPRVPPQRDRSTYWDVASASWHSARPATADVPRPRRGG